ncbi:Druantia anti-phage system protein DruA [Hymenobacter canadensis]|uniref:DUF4338 domain-containing protein n=1 Tax=Hymenobacter canadensis TaxID=2999067 RepID=A0ABY7LV25_9BACT|nr:Druantia anti-phage system protein DruA [Hymenobacter canadensis]WBA44240.1 DUF4338 domain-containing protein [Hymenobacter canadensis]
MEQTRLYRGQRVNVRVLLASPGQLSADLIVALAAPQATRTDQLSNLVQPYLQLASELPDEHTGLRLLDIWRYCRYTWSLPLQTQPGRRMFYLVRDKARPFHPIIGIAALGSAVVQISVRDHAIGWSLDSLADKKDPKANETHKHQRRTRVEALHQELARALAEIYRADLIEDGVLTEEECVYPTPATLLNLTNAADTNYLGSRERRIQGTDLEAEARSPTFRKKRVQVLQELLSARLEFNKCADLNGEEQYQYLMQCAEGKRALRMALRSVKKRHVAASLMEITTCGAVPPYGELLGGKLVAMLMASPQVINDYRERYDQFNSVIASRMQGSDLVRDANLVLLGTTSLYHVGSSQYNRVNFPGVGGKVEYKLLGKTEGYGSVHFSQKTYTTIQQLLQAEATSQSYTFAAGVNYKLRSMSAALGLLGLQKLQKHSTPRLVYAVPLAQNWQEYLTGQEKAPSWYFTDIKNPTAETEQIIEYWKKRWFLNRVQRPETLAHLQSSFRPDSLLDIKPAATAHAQMTESLLFFLGPDKPPMISWNTFAEFDNGRLSFAEKQTVDETQTIHITSKKLEDGIINLLKEGHRVYLTGNPGDGKTHLLRRLEGREDWPVGTYTELDASAVSETQLIEGLTETAKNGLPALVAINEGPLRHMLKRLPDAEELSKQLAHPYRYESDGVVNAVPKAVLVQLGSRQVLNNVIISEAINLMLSRVDYTGAPTAVLSNVKALGHMRVRERIHALLAEVQRSGIHVTVHQLLGLLARMVTGGSNEVADKAPPYYQTLFEMPAEASPLAAELRDLDPASFPHAHLDTHKLWDAPSKAGPWLPGSGPATGAPGELGISTEEARRRFCQLKRQHFFEAEAGEQVMAALPDDRRKFNELLTGSLSAAVPVILKTLVRFVGQAPENTVALHLWTGMRYDADQPAWARVAGASIHASDCVVRRPMLPSPMDELLEDYQPDHLLLTLAAKPTPQGPSLLIDLPLWRAMSAVARGLPISSRDEDAGRRVDNFLSAAASLLPSNSEYLRIYNSKDNIETIVQVVEHIDAPAGMSYLLS